MADISKHISYKEAIHTSTGLPNNPNYETFLKMQELAENIFEPLREYLGVPIKINSFFRSPEVNKAVGGVSDGKNVSQHVLGEAFDLDAGYLNIKIWNYVINNLNFDQAIWEHGTEYNPDWVHVSYRKGKNRKQKLRAIKKRGKTMYVPI